MGTEEKIDILLHNQVLLMRAIAVVLDSKNIAMYNVANELRRQAKETEVALCGI